MNKKTYSLLSIFKGLFRFVKKRPIVSGTWVMVIGTWIISIASILNTYTTGKLINQNIKMYEHERKSLELEFQPKLITNSIVFKSIGVQHDTYKIIWTIKNNSSNIAKETTVFTKIIFAEDKRKPTNTFSSANGKTFTGETEMNITDPLSSILPLIFDMYPTLCDKDLIKKIQDQLPVIFNEKSILLKPFQDIVHCEINEEKRILIGQNDKYLLGELNEQEAISLGYGGCLTSSDINKIKDGHASLSGIFTIFYKSAVGYYRYSKTYIGFFRKREFDSGEFSLLEFGYEQKKVLSK